MIPEQRESSFSEMGVKGGVEVSGAGKGGLQ